MYSSIPTPLLQSLALLPHFDAAAFLQAHQEAKPVTSIRLNPGKTNTHSKLISQNLLPIGWAAQGVYLPIRPAFTLDPTLHAGGYYVQEASSMFLEQVLTQSFDLSTSLKVLDLCAAPGGKSTHILSLLNNQSFLVSNEVIKSRAAVLAENITKWGAANAVVTNNDPKDFARLGNYFDVIVADAPCSGSGLFRKDPQAINEWSLDNVERCSQRQQRILADVWPALKPGGTLVYSTCSYSKKENEDIIHWMKLNFEIEGQSIQLQKEWNIETTETLGIKGYRFYPYKTEGEGFFISVWKKKGEAAAPFFVTKQDKPKPLAPAISILKQWLNQKIPWAFLLEKDEWLAMPQYLLDEINTLKKNCYIRKAGIKMGKLIRQDFIPDHELAMSQHIAPNLAFVAVNESTALQYLRKQEIQTDPQKKGWLLVQYNGYNLGWIKALGNRTNNYYPINWRIRKEGMQQDL